MERQIKLSLDLELNAEKMFKTTAQYGNSKLRVRNICEMIHYVHKFHNCVIHLWVQKVVKYVHTIGNYCFIGGAQQYKVLFTDLVQVESLALCLAQHFT